MRLSAPGVVLGALACAAYLSATACGRAGPDAAGETAAREKTLATAPAALPEFSDAVEESVRRAIRERHAKLTAELDRPQSTKAERSRAYGELGKMLMAAELRDPAEIAFRHALDLDATDWRWSYYLGHLSRDRGDLPHAAAFFEQVLQSQPDDVATRVWLADTYLSQGRPELAEPLLARALSLAPGSIAVQFAIGRAALARSDYRSAAERFEAILTVDKDAAAVHYPLAMAYRGLGDTARAEAQLAQRREGQILPLDPLMDELRGLVESSAAYERRGMQALNSGDWDTAIAQFRKGLALAPADPALRHRLGTALFQAGDVQGALDEFDQVVRVSPQFARAHYSLGVIERGRGRHEQARERFAAAVRADPGYVEARVALAAAMRRSGRALESLEEYRQLLELDPPVADAAFGYAMALVSLGRYQEARDRLADGAAAYPAHSGFPHALARVLAAAPEARVRDGHKAMTLLKPLLEREQTLDLGETMAMALAELGQFEEAAAFQRDVIAAAERSGRGDLARRMAGNLQRYESRQACRTPWREGELP